MKITDRTFLVTGGASGLGAAVATRLVAEGGKVLIADINTEAGKVLALQLGGKAFFVRTDITVAADVENALAVAQQQLGPLRGVVNCAGIAIAERTVNRKGEAHALESFARVLTINVLGTFNVIRLAAAAMAGGDPENVETGDLERGVMINTASIAAYDGQVGQAAYAASKAAIAGMTLPIARDLAGIGIRVVTIAPGIFDTPLLAGLPEAARLSLGQQVPFPSRLGRPAEYADLVMHILGNQMLNGEVIRLDGALRMAPQ